MSQLYPDRRFGGPPEWVDKYGRRYSERQAQFAVRDGLLQRMGFTAYSAYLESPTWLQGAKAEYLASDRPKECLICGSTEYDLHHRTYERLGSERLNDLVPLCHRHHEEVHGHVYYGQPLSTAHLRVKAKYDRMRHRALAAESAASTGSHQQESDQAGPTEGATPISLEQDETLMAALVTRFEGFLRDHGYKDVSDDLEGGCLEFRPPRPEGEAGSRINFACQECGALLEGYVHDAEAVRYWHCSDCGGAGDGDMRCPCCALPMAIRLGKKGKFSGHTFWYCETCPPTADLMGELATPPVHVDEEFMKKEEVFDVAPPPDSP